QLSSLAFLEGYDSRSRRPRMDRELLGRFSEGIIVLSGCLSGEVQKNLLAGKPDEARKVVAEYREIFGDRYYLEVQYQGLIQQPPLNEQLAEIGREMHIPLVATNDSHYTHKDDAGAHDILLCIQMGKELADTDRMRFDTDQFYLKSREEMDAAFPQYPEAVESTLGVAERCSIDIPLHNMLLPDFEVPEGETLASFLYSETEKGVRRRYAEVTPEILDRMRHELGVIEQMGFPGYFLVVADFVQWAKRQGIRVGPGRGSAGGSLVAYALGITELDPIRWNLGFERFLNPGRKQMPDIDIDFDERRRGEVIRYASERYGSDRVAQIITFSTIKAKQAMRDAARVLGLPYSVGDRLAKMYPPAILGKDAPMAACFDKNMEWPKNTGRNDAYPNAAELRKAFEEDQVSREVIEAARKLEGLRRQHSIHAAGVVIGREPLVNHVPLQRTDADGEIVTQYEQGIVEQIGLLKMDFLGLRNLTVIEDALAHIRANQGVEADVDHLPLDEPKVFELLQRGSSSGIFQMESPGMTRLLRQLRPDRFEEIAELIALYRPGPMDEIPRYVKGKHDRTSVTYLHPLLKQVLGNTNGVIVYQEQVTEILQVVGGFAPEAADMVRYAIGKKKSEVMAKAKDSFDAGAQRSGLTAKEAQALWELIMPFAGYSFNRAHANGYALIAYQTAWLKSLYPVEYMAALLTSVKANPDRMRAYLGECLSLQIKVMPPDVNSSQLDFSAKGKEVLFGLSAIRNVGESVAEAIVSARKSGYASFHDFCRRVPTTVLNKKVIESLAKAGAFDALGVDRSSLVERDAKGGLSLSEQATRVIEATMANRRSEDAGQFSLFGGADEPAGAAAGGESTATAYSHFGEQLVPGDVPQSDLLAAEKEMLGFYVSEHPLAGLTSVLRYQADAEVSELADVPDGTIKTVGGILSKLDRKFTKKGELMMVGTLEDMKSSVEILIFPATVNETPPELLAVDRVVLLKGRVDARDDAAKLVVLRVSPVDVSGAANPLRIKMSVSACTPDRIEELKSVLAAHPGPSPVLLHLGGKDKTTVLKLGGSFCVEHRNGLRAEILSILGAEALTV
ncbi:MAG TPA: DNA polymerase III subunit alpha, partial [Actinomycetota bacterium]|nr:DNA polymerase III subunit alpha [Actinomycetota bacterium]